jgi:formylglycine-generating enzyme required for sulfatase activity
MKRSQRSGDAFFGERTFLTRTVRRCGSWGADKNVRAPSASKNERKPKKCVELRASFCDTWIQMKGTRIPSSGLGLVAAAVLLAHFNVLAAAPTVSNVRSSQRAGTKLVDIYYDLADADSPTLTASVAVSTDGGVSYTLPATSFSGSGYGTGVTPGANKLITWNAGADWNGRYSANVRFRVTADDATVPSGMALIPAGSFTMGNCMNSSEGYSDELPLHAVYVSAFYMDKYLVTKALWDTVYLWALSRGYSFDYPGSGKAANHPVQTIDWYARSEQEGRVPAYYTDAGLSARYRTGQVAPYVNWGSGYRLPTEAEWEKGARGGLSGHRFPWGDTIDWSHANYNASPGSYAYDINATGGYDPVFNDGVFPYTSPVGYFAPNGYGLYDMAGNVWEWCWDWYGAYSSGSQTDARGPTSGSYRVGRGGSWGINAILCRAAYRSSNDPSYRHFVIGFRSVLSPGQ